MRPRSRTSSPGFPGSWARFALAPVTIALALVLAACAGGPEYDPVPADLCEDVVPLLADLRVTFQVNLQDDSIYNHLDGGLGESTHCYFRLSNERAFIALLVVVHTYPSPEQAEENHEISLRTEPSRGFEPAGTVDGVGERAEAFLMELDSGVPVTLYGLVCLDRNLTLLMELEISDDRHPAREAFADLMHPLASDVLGLLPQS